MLPANTTSGLNGQGTLPVTKNNAIKAPGRENVRIEYYVAFSGATRAVDAAKAEDILGASNERLVRDADGDAVGAWFEEDQDADELTRYMKATGHQVEGTECVYDINLYR